MNFNLFLLIKLHFKGSTIQNTIQNFASDFAEKDIHNVSGKTQQSLSSILSG